MGGGYPQTTYLICCAVPPDVALVIAHAASFLVLNSDLLRISTSIGTMLASITAWKVFTKFSYYYWTL